MLFSNLIQMSFQMIMLALNWMNENQVVYNEHYTNNNNEQNSLDLVKFLTGKFDDSVFRVTFHSVNI